METLLRAPYHLNTENHIIRKDSKPWLLLYSSLKLTTGIPKGNLFQINRFLWLLMVFNFHAFMFIFTCKYGRLRFSLLLFYYVHFMARGSYVPFRELIQAFAKSSKNTSNNPLVFTTHLLEWLKNKQTNHQQYQMLVRIWKNWISHKLLVEM